MPPLDLRQVCLRGHSSLCEDPVAAVPAGAAAAAGHAEPLGAATATRASQGPVLHAWRRHAVHGPQALCQAVQEQCQAWFASVQALLQEGMQELLKTAADTRASEPWPCIHALNVLCQAFNDRHLALDISGFCAQGRALANPMQPTCCFPSLLECDFERRVSSTGISRATPQRMA